MPKAPSSNVWQPSVSSPLSLTPPQQSDQLAKAPRDVHTFSPAEMPFPCGVHALISLQTTLHNFRWLILEDLWGILNLWDRHHGAGFALDTVVYAARGGVTQLGFVQTLQGP